MRNNRFIGAILLVAGTSIGAGMLALPVIFSFTGFIPSVMLLAICWLFLFTTSLLLLDVTLSFKEEVNLVTMAGKILKGPGKVVCWITYLALLYSLTAAYIAGSSPLFLNAFTYFTGATAPSWLGPFPLLILFGLFVYLGTQAVDWVNRLLMIGLILSYILLLAFLPPHVEAPLIEHIDIGAIWVAVPVLITSYGFHIIIPTLTTYLDHDRKKLRLVLFVGSLIPFIVYFLWNLLILGVVPIEGTHGLAQAYVNGKTAASSLSYVIQSPWMSILARAFSFFAIVTSFLGVSLSLSDFLSDGLHLKRFSLERELACLATFIPPLIFVLLYPKGFIVALEFAGIFVAILLCILPALMAWKLKGYQTGKKKALLSAVLIASALVIVLNILEEFGLLTPLIQSYLSV